MKRDTNTSPQPINRFAVFVGLFRGRGSGVPSCRRVLLTILSIIALPVLLLAPTAQAGRVPGFGVLGGGALGAGAGQLGSLPQGVAVNTTGAGGVSAGDVYVSDATNNRISEYSGSGTFIRTFGQNVVASGPDNVTPASAKQSIEVPSAVTAGTFKIAFNGATTGGTGTGTLTEGSNAVIALVTAKGTGSVKAGSFSITGLTTSVGQFAVGQPISGNGIPAGAKVTNVSGSTITLSAAATAEGTGVELTSSGPLPFSIGEAISGSGIPAGTTITATGAGALTLSAPVEAGHSGTAVALTANLPYNATATAVQSALTALGTIGTGNATVTGGPGAAAPYSVTFAGTLKEAPMPLIVANSAGLTGGAVAVSTTIAGVSPNEICNVAANPTDVCEKGTSNSIAGGIAAEKGIAIDPVTGNVYVTSNTSERINVYSATGAFEGAFGWKVNATTPAEELQFCTYATGCAAGTSGGNAGQFGSFSGEGNQGATPAVSPVNGHLFVPEPGNKRVDEFNPSLNGAKEVTGVSFVKAFGADVTPTINEKQAVTLSGATGGTFALNFNSQSTDTSGIGNLKAGSNEISGLSVLSGTFVRGEEVLGAGIPTGTRITAVTFDSLTLTAGATETNSGATLSASLPFNAESSAVQAALQSLPGIGSGNVVVTGANGGPWTVEFKGSLAGTNVAQLLGTASKLTGTAPSVGVVTTQTGANGAGTGFETCTAAITCKAGIAGNGKNGTFVASAPDSVAVDSIGTIYVTGQRGGVKCESACGVEKFNAEGASPEEFASAQLSSPEEAAPIAVAARWVAVDPSNDHVLVVKRVTSTTFKLYEFTRNGAFIGVSPPGEAGFATHGTDPTNQFGPQGLAVGTAGRAYIAFQGIGSVPVRIFSSPPAPVATIEPASGVSQVSATLSGVAQPSAPGIEGGFATVAYFEYSANGVIWQSTEPISIGTGSGSGSPNSCPTGNPPSCNISQKVTGLLPGQAYLARMVVSNGTASTSSTASFETSDAGPSVYGMSSDLVGQASATLVGKVNPNNKPTTYHFEWGTDTSYGTRIPVDFESVAGSGGQPVKVSANISGLQPGATYHFRIVAESSEGTIMGPDGEFTTLNSSALPDNRGIELVSPVEKQPAGTVYNFLPLQIGFEATEDGESVSYPIFNGLEGSTAGGKLIFTAQRTPGGWNSTQLTPSSRNAAQRVGTASAGEIRYIDHQDSKCAIIESANPLTADTPAPDIENGVYNLYRWMASTGSYTLITDRVPVNPTAESISSFFEVAGATPNCSKVFFRSKAYSYIIGASPLYEWDTGTLRDAGLRPDRSVPTGEVGTQVALNEDSVSPDGRLFFTAISNAGKDSGKQAVFVRKSVTETVDASQSTTATSSLGAKYETASPDGSHVFFLANYGLTLSSSSGPAEECTETTSTAIRNLACDLYDFDVSTGQLTDISADSNPADSKGAVTQGVMDVSEDGSTVYFAARGQLVPGQGNTYGQNLQGSGMASVYRWHKGSIKYVGALTALDVNENGSGNNQGALIHRPKTWVAQATNNGEYLLFVSRANISGANQNGISEAYLYSASSESLECVSCPGEGVIPRTYPAEPEQPELISRQLANGEGFANYHPRSLSEDGRVIFTSYEALVPEAVENQPNIYEWYRGQLSLLTSGPSKFQDMGGPDGRDVFISSYGRLAPQDVDFAADLYDFRSGGGGFAAPELRPPSCEPAADECQGTPVTPPNVPAPATSGPAGPGNPPLEGKRHGRHHKKVRQHHKKVHRKRAANSNRGGAK